MVSPSVGNTLRYLMGIPDEDQPDFEGPRPYQEAPDPDVGPHEALPGSVGAGPVGPLYGPEPVPAPAATPDQVSRYVPSYAPQAAQVTPEDAPTSNWTGAAQSAVRSGQAGLEAGLEAARAVAPIVGVGPPETFEQVAYLNAPGPVRAGKAIVDTLSAAGGGAVGQAAEEVYGTEPVGRIPATPYTPEIPFTAKHVGTGVGMILGDPTTYAGVGAAGRAADQALANLVKPVARPIGRSLGAAARSVGRALAPVEEELPEGVRLAGGGFSPSARRPEGVIAGAPPGERGAEAARYAAELEAGGAPASSVKNWQALAQADLANPNELEERLATVPFVSAEEARRMMGDRPEYLEPVAQFLLQQRQKLLSGAMTARDVAKAYALTVMSMRSSASEQRALEAKLAGGFTRSNGEVIAGNPELANLDAMIDPRTGRPLGAGFTEANPRTGAREVRPESIGAAWLWTSDGQRALDGMDEGEFVADAWDGLRRTRAAFGSDTVGGNGVLRPLTPAEISAGKVNMTNLPQFVDELNAGIAELQAAGRQAEIPGWLTAQARRLNGVSTGKSEFVKFMLGFGDAATVDAREINYWLSGKGLPARTDTGPGFAMARAVGRWWQNRAVASAMSARVRAAVDELTAQYPELMQGLDPQDAGAILHHWLWDKSGGSRTTHGDLMEAVQRASGFSPRARADLANAAQGAFIGGYAPDLTGDGEQRERTPQEMAARTLGGAAFGTVAGRHMTRAASGLRRAGAGAVPEAPLPPLFQRVVDTYRAVTPGRVTRSTDFAVSTSADQVARSIARQAEEAAAKGRPAPAALGTDPAELMGQVHAAIVRNLEDTKTVMTGLRPGAIKAYLRGEGLTTKVDTGDLDTINQITQAQVNVGGKRAGQGYTLEDAGRFAQYESEQMRMASGGTRFPDPETGEIDTEAPRAMYAYVGEGQPLVGPNRPNLWLAWEDDTPRATSASHPFMLGAGVQDIHANMREGLRLGPAAAGAVRGSRMGEAIMEGGRLVEAVPNAPGATPMRFGWERGGVDLGGGRRMADTDWLVGPEGENPMRASGLTLSMPQNLIDAIARGEMSDPEQIAAVLMRGGAPQWKSGWASVMNPSRSESLILDPRIENVKAIYLTATPDHLGATITGTASGRGKAKVPGLTEEAFAKRLQADIKAQTGKDVPIYWTDITEAGKPTAMADAKLLGGTPIQGGLSPGRGRIVGQYTQATDPATGQPYKNIGSGFVPSGDAGVRYAGSGFVPADEAPGSGLGNVPPSARRQLELGPGFEPNRPPERIPAVSDEPNRPRVLGDLPPSAVQQLGLPGMEPPYERVPPPVPASPGSAEAVAEMRATGSPGLPEMEDRGLLRRVADAVSPWANRVNILRYAGMLSDTAGHVYNIASGGVMAGVDVATTPITALFDMARVGAARTVPGLAGLGTERQAFMGELPARLSGMIGGGRSGLAAAGDILKTGVSPEDAAKMDQARPGFGTNIPGLAPAGSRQAAVADFAVEVPLRALAAADAVFRQSAAGGHLAAEAYAAAKRAAGGADPTALQLKAAMQDPKLLERVEYLSRRSVLQEDRVVTDLWRDAMNGLRARAPGMDLAVSTQVPFVRTPYNVVAQGMGLTPAGLAGVVQDVASGRSAREVEQRLARVALGTAVMGVASADYMAGNLTGPYPEDAATRSTLPPGWRPWSRKVTLPDGTVFYLPLAALGPLALPFVGAILLGEAGKQGKGGIRMAGQVAAGVGKYAAQNTFFEGVGGVLKALDDPGRFGERYAEQMAQQFSPHIVGGGALGREIQRIVGMPARDPEGMLEALLATHPLTASRVPVRQDVLGRAQSLGPSGPVAVVARGGLGRDASVLRAFRTAGEGLPTPPKDLTDPSTKEKTTLSRAQQATWRREFGRELQDQYASYGFPDDRDTLRRVEQRAREAANDAALGRR